MLRFAVAGCPLSTPAPGGTVKGLKRAAEMGIRAMEMEWVQSVPKNPERMNEIRAIARDRDIALTVHAPYYVNLNSTEEAKLEASIKRVVDALTMAQLAGAVSVCVHAAFYLGCPPDEAMERVSAAAERILAQKAAFPDVNLAFETMGKHTQFGTLDEALAISKRFGLYPCVDFAHLHARANGKANTAAEWDAMLDRYEASLGKGSLQRMHIHYSGIEYGSKGEKFHLPVQESDANWHDLLAVLKKREVGGILVVESPILEEDTVFLQEQFAAIG